MIKVYLDTCAYINLLKPENRDLHDLFIRLINENKIELFISHGIHDDGFWQNIEHIPKTMVPTGCFVCGYSRLKQARLGNPENVYTKLTRDIPNRTRNRNAVWDAIHYATAHFERLNFFVSDDSILKKKIEERIPNNIPTITLIEFKEKLESL